MLIFVFLFVGVLVMCTRKTDESITHERGFILNARAMLEDDELSRKKLEALKGEPEAAHRIAVHFRLDYKARNPDESIQWYTIAVENGHLDAQYGLTLMIVNRENDENFRVRRFFWLYTMFINDYRIEETEIWLTRLGYTFDTAKPPDDSNFHNGYSQLNESQLELYKDGALRGNKRAAFVLGKYYSEIQIDNDLSEYWHRIGAQNGNLECQYILGQILHNKDNEHDQVRGDFWLRKAKESRSVNLL